LQDFFIVLPSFKNSHTQIILKNKRKENIERMAKFIDSKDSYAKGHSEEVRAIAVGIGKELNRKEEDIEQLEIMATIHDFTRLGNYDIKEIMEEIKETPDLSKIIPKLINNLDRIEPTFEHYYESFEEEIGKNSLEEIVAVADAYTLFVNPPGDILSPEEAFDRLESDERFSPKILNALWIAQDKRRLLREKKMFLQKKEEIQKEYPDDKFVVLSSGEVIGRGNDDWELARKYGSIPIYIGQLRGERKVAYMLSPKRGNTG
ncbi:MAG: hypothetical protein QME42_10825, partial [bacterium]|nr:hypothetical protein [bacterium]